MTYSVTEEVKFDHIGKCPVCNKTVLLIPDGTCGVHSVPNLSDLSDEERCEGSGQQSVASRMPSSKAA